MPCLQLAKSHPALAIVFFVRCTVLSSLLRCPNRLIETSCSVFCQLMLNMMVLQVHLVVSLKR